MSNDYYKTALAAQLTSKERELIKSIASRFADCQDAVFVNIGVMWGGTLHCLRAGSANAHLYGIDIDFNTYKVDNPGGLELVTWICGDSRTMYFDKQIDVLLIDGDHHYETVKADIQNWVGLVKVGGYVIFHDYDPSSINMKQFPHLVGVKNAVSEWYLKSDGWETEAIADSVIVFKRHR